MNPQAAPSATPVPIHDISGPISFFPYPLWMVAMAILVLFGLAAFGIWLFILRRKPPKRLTAVDKALAALARLRGEVETGDPYAFSIAVSDVLRVYLRDEHGLSATTQTSREFLEAVRSRNVFNEEENSALTAFLEKADLIKFARLHATAADCSALLEQAGRLVQSRKAKPSEAAAR